jgi:hypothetical protein
LVGLEFKFFLFIIKLLNPELCFFELRFILSQLGRLDNKGSLELLMFFEKLLMFFRERFKLFLLGIEDVALNGIIRFHRAILTDITQG